MTRTSWILATTVLLALAAGCSSEPGRTAASGPITGPAAAMSLEASAWIGSEGGSLESGGARVVIPSGALPEPLFVVLESGETAGRTWCRIQPAGLPLVAAAEVLLPLPAAAAPGQLFRMVTVDDETGARQVLPGDAVGEGVLGRPVQFSRYELELIE